MSLEHLKVEFYVIKSTAVILIIGSTFRKVAYFIQMSHFQQEG